MFPPCVDASAGSVASASVASEMLKDGADGAEQSGWRLLQLSACDILEEELAMEKCPQVVESGVIAAVLLDPDGDAAGRFGHSGACRAMASMMVRQTRPKRLHRFGGRLRRRRQGPREAWIHKEATSSAERSKPADDSEKPSPQEDASVCSVAADFFLGHAKVQAKLDLSSWMASLPEQLPISQVSIPGTHDSATFQMTELSRSWEYLGAFGRTQEWDLPTQLSSGVRFFDLRVKGDGWLYHGPMACSLNLQKALESCAAFLQEHQSEFLILRIKDEERSRTSAQKIQDLVKRLSKSLPLHFSMDLQLVGHLRGQMFVLQDWYGRDASLRWDGPSMKVQDFWSPGSWREKWVAIQKHLRAAPRRQGDRLCANFVSAQSFPRRTPRYFAGILNPRLCATISRGKHHALGIVVMDFPTRDLCMEIVRKNFMQSQVAASRVLRALDGCSEEYGGLLREIDGAALAPAVDEESVQKLSAVYSRLLLQRSIFVIAANDIQEKCKAQRQVPSELHLTASQISWVWEKEMQRMKRTVREVAKTHPALPVSDGSDERKPRSSRRQRGTVQLHRGDQGSPIPQEKINSFL